MGTIACSRILDRAAVLLLDDTGVLWSPASLLDYLNAGLNAIVANKPDAYTQNIPVLLLANETRQEIPADGIQFLALRRNMGVAGTTIGRVITQVGLNHLDHSDVDWHTRLGEAIVHVMHDPRDPNIFWTYPQIATPWYVQLVYSAHPPLVAAASILPIDDLYENPLCHWVLANAYAKNSKRGDLGKTNAYLTLFAQAIGAKSQVQFSFAPAPPDADAKAP